MGLMLVSGAVLADDLKPFQPFDLSANKSLARSSAHFNSFDGFFNHSINANLSSEDFDFLSPQSNGYHLSKNEHYLFGDELVVGMKFADWLTLRLSVVEDSDSLGLFSRLNQSSVNQVDTDFSGFQLAAAKLKPKSGRYVILRLWQCLRVCRWR